MIEHELLQTSGGIRHGFFTRRGGVSTGLYDSLNCGFGSSDEAAAVAENRRRCAERLGVRPDTLTTVYQVHGIEVVQVREPWPPAAAPKADALVTDRPGVALGILTADCTPILLADPAARVIGAAHAGWKGAKAGMATAVVEAMVRLGANRRDIVAVVGPTIGQSSYEVGSEFRAAFIADRPLADAFFIDGPSGRPHFDLPGFVIAELEGQGLAGVAQVGADTCADAERLFSYRRSCLRKETDYGRQLSAIALA